MPRNHDSQKPKEKINSLKLDISDEMIAERRGGSGPMPKDMPKWMASTITKIDLTSKWIGNVVCWITIPLIFAMVYEVLARKLFNAPTMWAYDMSRFMYAPAPISTLLRRPQREAAASLASACLSVMAAMSRRRCPRVSPAGRWRM